MGSDYFTPDGCNVCSDHLAELADISFGDAWLPEFEVDKLGTSIAISRTKLGEEFLAKARLNNGTLIEKREAYVAGLLIAKNAVTIAEENLADHKEKIAFSEEELKNLSEEEEVK